MKKTAKKINLLAEATKRKMEAQKTGGAAATFGKFHTKNARNTNNSNVGASWGPRKGN